MTRQQAYKEAQRRWGRDAAVKMEPKGARVGFHGEYLPSHIGNNRKGDPREGHYLCDRCSTMSTDGVDIIENRVWHPLGGFQTRYSVGVISLGMFFSVRGEAESFKIAFNVADQKGKL